MAHRFTGTAVGQAHAFFRGSGRGIFYPGRYKTMALTPGHIVNPFPLLSAGQQDF